MLLGAQDLELPDRTLSHTNHESLGSRVYHHTEDAERNNNHSTNLLLPRKRKMIVFYLFVFLYLL